MKLKYLTLTPVVLVVLAAALLAPVLAQPNFAKYVASLEVDGDRFGQVIFNTNWEDDFEGYEFEVEVEECSALDNSTVTVKLDGGMIDTLYIDEFGNGKATFYVEAITNMSNVTVEGDVTTLTSGDWRDWVKGPGPK